MLCQNCKGDYPVDMAHNRCPGCGTSKNIITPVTLAVPPPPPEPQPLVSQPPVPGSGHKPDKIMSHFTAGHLREGVIRDTSIMFCDLAQWVHANIPPGPERSACLRKLLEAKDAGVRAVVKPGH